MAVPTIDWGGSTLCHQEDGSILDNTRADGRDRRRDEATYWNVGKYPEYIRDYTKHAAEFVHRVSRTIGFYATLPLYTAFFVCLFVASVPILVQRFFATGEPPE